MAKVNKALVAGVLLIASVAIVVPIVIFTTDTKNISSVVTPAVSNGNTSLVTSSPVSSISPSTDVKFPTSSPVPSSDYSTTEIPATNLSFMTSIPTSPLVVTSPPTTSEDRPTSGTSEPSATPIAQSMSNDWFGSDDFFSLDDDQYGSNGNIFVCSFDIELLCVVEQFISDTITSIEVILNIDQTDDGT